MGGGQEQPTRGGRHRRQTPAADTQRTTAVGPGGQGGRRGSQPGPAGEGLQHPQSNGFVHPGQPGPAGEGLQHPQSNGFVHPGQAAEHVVGVVTGDVGDDVADVAAGAEDLTFDVDAMLGEDGVDGRQHPWGVAMDMYQPMASGAGEAPGWGG